MHMREFQQLMKQLYLHRDEKRGIKETYNWLVDEVQELGEALETNNQEAVMNECADVIAWLSSLSNVIGIDLERATLRKYNGKCPKCQFSPCKCEF